MAFEGLGGALRNFADDESGKEISPDAMADTMAKALRTSLATMTLYAAMPDGAAAAEKHPHSRIEQSVEQGFSKKDSELVAKNVFFEAGIEGPMGQLAVAQVTFARLASGRWGNTMHEVIYAKHQFTWTANEKKLEGAALVGVEQLADVFASRFKGKSAEQIVRELSAITGLPPETLFYKRADWNEHDPDETRMTERTKRVFQSLIWLKNVGEHAFYMDPPKVARLEKRAIRN
ncbi:cell wall hydrolase [Candidatus Kaiserbacteria bacterium]|nr:cell wall hydrolase [Candidatus Kaiserbacteria bacterium]